MWLFATSVVVIGLVFVSLARRRIPNTYRTINTAGWIFEGFFFLLAIIALIYHLFTGQPL